jgi:serine/threonine protein kinase
VTSTLPVVEQGTYAIEGEHARGGLGRILRARDRRLDRPVAVKELLREGGDAKARFVREAMVTARLQHPAIVPVYEAGRWPTGAPFFAMKLVAGRPLDAVIREAKTLPERLALLPKVIAIAEAMAYAHGERVIHRDLKPANVMIETFDDETQRARILDFGLAKVVHGEHLVTGLTERDMIFGTPEYMAPEQARGDEVDARCDVYACGVMLYEMLTGTVPIRGATPLATMTAQLVEPVEPPRARSPGRDIPPALEAVVLRALDKDPDKRYGTAALLAEALEAACERRVISITVRHSTDDIHARDTELALRRSQIQKATGLLEEAEKLAASKSSSSPPTPRRAPAGGARRDWLWAVVAAVAIGTCIAVGVLLALK